MFVNQVSRFCFTTIWIFQRYVAQCVRSGQFPGSSATYDRKPSETYHTTLALIRSFSFALISWHPVKHSRSTTTRPLFPESRRWPWLHIERPHTPRSTTTWMRSLFLESRRWPRLHTERPHTRKAFELQPHHNHHASPILSYHSHPSQQHSHLNFAGPDGISYFLSIFMCLFATSDNAHFLTICQIRHMPGLVQCAFYQMSNKLWLCECLCH